MKLAFTVPVSFLLEVSQHDDFHFLLAHLYENPIYQDFFKQNNDKKFRVIDNSEYEKKRVETAQLLKVAEELKCDEIVIPDVWGNFQETEQLFKKFKKEYLNVPFRKMAVIQARTLEDFVLMLMERNADEFVSTLGIPKYVCFEGDEISRYWLLSEIVKRFHIQKPVHMLGTVYPKELLLFSEFNFIRSVDSSLAYKASKKKVSFLNFNESLIDKYLDFEEENFENQEIFFQNVFTSKMFAEGKVIK